MLELADRHDLGLTKAKVNVKQLLNEFIASRRQGLSPHTIAYYRQCLTPLVLWHELTPQSITEFLRWVTLQCRGQTGLLQGHKGILQLAGQERLHEGKPLEEG